MSGRSLQDKSAIVTGSSRGIGRAIALELARNGARVVVNCRSRVDLAREVVDEIERIGGQAILFQSDISSEEGAKSLVQACIEKFGRIDVLVNNAGIMIREEIEKIKNDSLLRTIQVDLLSCFYTSKYAILDMVKRGEGSIVNVSSIVGMIGLRGATAYAAAKAGLNGLTVCLAREVARFGIRVNGVAPGYVETEMIEDWPEEHFAKILPRIPMRRFAKPEEVAKVVNFLAGDATYITGQTIIVDGGIMID